MTPPRGGTQRRKGSRKERRRATLEHEKQTMVSALSADGSGLSLGSKPSSPKDRAYRQRQKAEGDLPDVAGGKEETTKGTQNGHHVQGREKKKRRSKRHSAHHHRSERSANLLERLSGLWFGGSDPSDWWPTKPGGATEGSDGMGGPYSYSLAVAAVGLSVVGVACLLGALRLSGSSRSGKA